jgi:hypothetical protein
VIHRGRTRRYTDSPFFLTELDENGQRFLLLWLFIVAMNIEIAGLYRDSCHTEPVTTKEPPCNDSPQRELDDLNTNSSLQS